MTPSPDATDDLVALKAAHCDAARAHILVGEVEQTSARIREAELVDRLVRLSGRAHRAPVFAIVLTAACALLAFAAWKVKLSTFVDLEVSIRGETTAAELTLARPTVFEPFHGAAVELGRLSSLSAQILELPRDVTGGYRSVQVRGRAPVEVKGLGAPGGARVALGLVPIPGKSPTLVLRAYTPAITGDVLVHPGTFVSASTADDRAASDLRLAGDVLDVISFGCGDCTDAPMRMDVREAESFIWGSVPVDRLGFAMEHVQPDGTTYFTSGLTGGSIRLLDADRTETVENGDGLKLDLARVRRFQIGRSATQNTLSFVYDGTVGGLSLGPVGAERDLSPSVLEFLYRQKALALLWGASAFLWGLFTGVRKLWQAKAD